MLTNVVGWVLFGLIVGAVARMLYPGREGLGWLGTMALGIAGSLVGGGVAYALRLGQYPYTGAGWILSIVGALALLGMGFFVRRPASSTRY
jgi:uncharacterized membrane protein YeaQ/YmgE (transglycosylase-associated protein family)